MVHDEISLQRYMLRDYSRHAFDSAHEGRKHLLVRGSCNSCVFTIVSLLTALPLASFLRLWGRAARILVDIHHI